MHYGASSVLNCKFRNLPNFNFRPCFYFHFLICLVFPGNSLVKTTKMSKIHICIFQMQISQWRAARITFLLSSFFQEHDLIFMPKNINFMRPALQVFWEKIYVHFCHITHLKIICNKNSVKSTPFASGLVKKCASINLVLILRHSSMVGLSILIFCTMEPNLKTLVENAIKV